MRHVAMLDTYVPGRSAVVALGGIVVALAVAAHDQYLVSHTLFPLAVGVEILDPSRKALPLGLEAVGIVLGIGWIIPFYEAKVVLRL